MNTACDTLLHLHRQCSGLRPTPSLIVGAQPNVSAHIKCSVVLRLVEDQLTPSLRECVKARLCSEASLFNGLPLTPFGHPFARVNPTVPQHQVVSPADLRAAIPVLLMMSQIIRACAEVHRDGGWALAYLLGKGIQKLLWIVAEPGFRPSCVYHGIRAVEQWVATAMQDDSVPVLQSIGVIRRLTTRAELVDYCKASARLTGWVSPSVERSWMEALVDGIRLCTDATGGKLFPNRLRFSMTSAASSSNENGCAGANPSVQVICGIILDWQLPLEAQLLFQQNSDHLEHIACVAFREAITDDHCSVLMACIQRVRACASSGSSTPSLWKNLRLVACQKTIAPQVRYELFQAGVVALERLSLRFIDIFAAVCGCIAMNGLEDLCLHLDAVGSGEPPLPSEEEGPSASTALRRVVGQLDALRSAETSIGGRYRMTLLGCEGVCSVHTMLFHVTDDAQHMESFFEEQLTSAFQSLCHLLSQGALVVRGAGYFERFLADYIAAWMVLHEGRDDIRRSRAVATTTCRVLSSLREDCYSASSSRDAAASIHDNDDSQAMSRAAMIAAAYFSRRPRRGCAPPGLSSHEESSSHLAPLGLDEIAQCPPSELSAAATWDSWQAKRDVMLNVWETWSTMVLIDECQLEQPV